MKILVINAGSSSLKYQLIDMETEQVLAKGLCERIGIDGHLKHSPLVGGKPVFNEDLPMPRGHRCGHREAHQRGVRRGRLHEGDRRRWSPCRSRR